MINFKQQDEVLPSALNLLAIVLLVGGLGYMWFTWLVKPATPASISTSAQRRIVSQISDAKLISGKVVQEVRPKLWEGNSDTVAASVLGILTKATTAQSLKLSAFRPQRPQDLTNITELPYSVQISGQYPGIRAVLQTLDSKDSKVAIRSVQISSSGEASHEVSATLNLSVYVPGNGISEILADASEPASDKSEASTSPIRPAPHARMTPRLRVSSAPAPEGGNHA